MTPDHVGVPGHPPSKLGAGAGNMMGLRGYVGTPTRDGHVLLYASLDDLSESVEIPGSAIIQMVEATDSGPPGAMILWIKKGAEVTYHRVESARTPAQESPRRCRGGAGMRDLGGEQ